MKKIVVCLNFDPKNLDSLDQLNGIISTEECEITLLHLWESKAFAYPGGLNISYYPGDEQLECIKNEMGAQLREQYQRFEGLPLERFHTKIISGSNAKEKTIEFLKDYEADLVVSVTPQRSGMKDFFHSSFTKYLSSHAPCSVLALRTTYSPEEVA